MALVICRECGQEISDKAKFCPVCGAPNKILDNEGPENPEEIKIKKHVDYFLKLNSNMFSRKRIQMLKQSLYRLNPTQLINLELVELRDPELILVVSIFFGYIGIDRFLIGDTTKGIFKIILTFCCGIGLIWWFIDWFIIYGKTLEYNYRNLHEYLSIS